MYKVFVHYGHLSISYQTNVIPMVGDIMAVIPEFGPANYKVSKRLLHVADGMENCITIDVEDRFPLSQSEKDLQLQKHLS